MKYSSVVLARDTFSAEYVKNELMKKHNGDMVKFCPDVAFALDPIKPPVDSVKPPITGSNYIGINVSGLLYNGGYSRDNMFGLRFDYKSMIHKLVVKLLDVTDSDVVMIPHVFSQGIESDQDACMEVYNKIKDIHPGRVHVVCNRYDQSQIKSIIGQCDFFIGSRMHTCIAAVSQLIPCIGIAYSRKFSGVFESIGIGAFILDGRSVDEGRLIEMCIDLLRHKDSASAILRQNVLPIKEQLLLEFSVLINQCAS
jgi:polysaccharide pyruvyl transferase WcaK-like protein